MIKAKTFKQYANAPSAFRSDLMVDVDGSVKRFGDVMDPWQCEDFAALDPALKACNGTATEQQSDTIMRAYLERSRGHSKTTDLAVMCCWVLAFANRALKGYAFAADRDQAALLKDAIETLIRLNPWLSKILEVQKNQVINVANNHPGIGGRLEIFTSDVSSSYGILPDFIIADELCHWQGDGSLWHSIISSAAKRSNCLLAVISNAGFIDSWQWAVRESARTDDAWYFSRLDGPVASWLTESRLAEQRRMLPAIAYSRLWLNKWSTGGGDALTTEDIEAAFIDGLQPMQGNEDGYLFVAGLDLGLTRDCAALVVLAVPEGGKAGKIRLAHNMLWRPTLGKKINLLDVERHILEVDEQFGLEFVGFDPWQAEHLAQTLEADTNRQRRSQRRFFNEPWMRELAPVAANLRQQATLTIEFFQDHRFELYDCEPLRRDLHKLRVEEKNYGCRLVSPRDGEGHGDTFSAFAISLVLAHELAGKQPIVLKAWGPHDRIRGSSAWDEFALRQADYAQEHEEMLANDNDPSGFLDAVRFGGVTVFGTNNPFE